MEHWDFTIALFVRLLDTGHFLAQRNGWSMLVTYCIKHWPSLFWGLSGMILFWTIQYIPIWWTLSYYEEITNYEHQRPGCFETVKLWQNTARGQPFQQRRVGCNMFSNRIPPPPPKKYPKIIQERACHWTQSWHCRSNNSMDQPVSRWKRPWHLSSRPMRIKRCDQVMELTFGMK